MSMRRFSQSPGRCAVLGREARCGTVLVAVGEFDIVLQPRRVERLLARQGMRLGEQHLVIVFPHLLKRQFLFIQKVEEVRLVLHAVADDAQPEAGRRARC